MRRNLCGLIHKCICISALFYELAYHEVSEPIAKVSNKSQFWRLKYNKWVQNIYQIYSLISSYSELSTHTFMYQYTHAHPYVQK